MNKVILTGRLTANPELRYTQNNVPAARFTLAVNRDYKKENQEREADFINIIAWRKLAETVNKYLKKGNRIGIVGKIQTGSYTKQDGSKGYTTDVVISEIEFLESKPKEEVPTVDEEENNEIQLTDDDLPF